MALGKMLNLGGIDNRPPKANQSMGRFRVARNVYPTPDGTIIPRYDCDYEGDAPLRVKAYHHITQYGNDTLRVVSRDHFNTGAGTEIYQFYNGIDLISGYTSASPFQILSQDINNSVMSYRKNNTTYFMLPEYSGLPAKMVKYDGVQMWPMGSPQPIISSPQYSSVGTNFIRAIQHTIDFDNNEVASEYVQFPIAPAASITVRVDGGATNIIPNANVFPSAVLTSTSTYSYFQGGLPATYVGSPSFHYTITATATNLTSAKVGEYVFVGSGTWNPALINIAENGYGIAMKVKAVSGLNITLDALNVKYLNLNREWKTAAGPILNLDLYISYGTQTFMSFWRAASSTGVYFFSTLSPSFPSSTTAFNVTVDTSPVTSAESGSEANIITLSGTLNDIYSVTTRKLPPNSAYPFGLNYGFYCMTNFQDLMLLATDDLIWFSDPTLGGSYEQLNTSSFIRVGDTEYGRITSICGTQDFLFVSRERKNYYVTGNITTGNYRVQEIIEAEIGAWSNNSSILIKDSVVFLTAIGVFQIVGGGKATKLSETCPKNFERYDNNNVNEDVSFVMSGFVSDITNTTVDGLSVAYDEYRELLVFMKKGVAGNPSLVCHTKTGEFYEWDGITTGFGVSYANCLAFAFGKYLFGQIDNTANNYLALVGLENYAKQTEYVISYPVKLYTTWLTAGEPSLEKELLQLKLFGRIESQGTTSSIRVAHYKDWDFTTKITNVEYYPNSTALSLNNQVQYSHKKRLNSDKVLSTSVGVEIVTYPVSFEIESFEVEFNPIQSGMKK